MGTDLNGLSGGGIFGLRPPLGRARGIPSVAWNWGGSIVFSLLFFAAACTSDEPGETEEGAAGFLVVPSSGLITRESGSASTFTIRLASPPSAAVTIPLSSSNPNEGTVNPQSVTFAPGGWNHPQTVTVTGVDDALVDGNQPYTVLIAAAISADFRYDGLDPPDVSVTNLDDDGPENEVRFVALGDTGTGEQSQFDVAAAMEQKCAADGCDFALLLGDIIYGAGAWSADDPQWAEKFELPYAALNFPFYAALGNHDYSGDPVKGTYYVAYSAQNAKFVLPAEFYPFEQGEATFLALGTELLLMGSAAERAAAASAQGTQFTQALEQSTKPWRLAFGHHPYVSNGSHGNAGNYDGVPSSGIEVKEFFEQFLCGNVDVYFAGHDHDLEVLPGPTQCPMVFVVSGGGGRALRGFSGSNPFHFQKTSFGFAYIRLTAQTLTLQMLTTDGGMEYEMTLTK